MVNPDDSAGGRSAERTRSKMIADFESANFTEMVARPHFAAGDAFACEKMRGSNPSRSEEGALILEFCPGWLAEQKAGTDRIDVDVIGVAENQIRLPSWPRVRYRLLNSMTFPKVGRD